MSSIERKLRSIPQELPVRSFHPALENGKPVEKWAHVTYVWTLG